MDDALTIHRLESDLSKKPDDPSLYFHLGLLHLGEENFATASRFLARATSLDQHMLDANYYLGISYACQGNINLAVVEWEALLKLDANYYREKRKPPPVSIDLPALVGRALREIINRRRESPDSKDLAYSLGLAYLCFNQLEMARKELEETVSLDPDYARAYLPLAEVYTLLNVPARAIFLLEKFIRLRPQSFEGHLKLGQLYIGQRNVNSAVSQLRLALQTKPDSAEVYCELGKAFRIQNNSDMAEKAFTKALSLNSDCAEAHYERGQLYEEMYDFEKAIKEYQRAVSVNPSMGKLYLSLGNLYRRLGKPHEAIECIEKAFVFFPEDAEAHTQIAEAYVAIRKYPEALNHYRKAVALNPKDIYAHYNMGIAFAQTGQYEEAMRAYTRALEINPEFVEPLYDLALACLQRGRLAEAEGYISLFLDKRPNNTFARFTLGSIYLRLEDLDRAIEEYTRAINSYPSHPYARFNLASGYARLGQYEKAEAEFREALDANPPKTEDEIILFATLASSQSIIQSLGKAMTELKRAFQLYEEATSRYQLEETVKNRIRGLFTRFVPETVVDRVIASDESVELEVRNVTVLFADIQGYSGLSEAESPRETMALLNEYYAHMAGIYRKYGGTLLYFQGDAQMIIFGAPVERPNHALLALRTAVDMRKEIGLIARKLSQQGRRSFEVGIGICKGEAVLGFINDGSRLQYTAIGDTVNTASRLQEVSKQHDYAIMVNEAVQREVKDFVDSERLEAVQLRGKAEPVTVYRILRLREEALRQDSPLYTLESAPSLAEITAPMPEAPVILAKVTAPSAGIAVPSAEISAPSAEIAVPSPEAPVISSPPVRPHLPPPMKPKALSGPTPPRGEAIEASD